MAQHPPNGETFVIEYARGNPDYPVLGVRHDPASAAYRKPVAAHAHPKTSLYPNHTFTGTQLTNTDNTIIWIYRRLPEPEAEGQDVDRDLDITVGYVEQVKALGVDIGTAGKEIRPGEYGERTAVVRTYSGLSAALNAFFRPYPSLVDLSNDLPDVLQSIAVVWDEDSSDGDYTETGDGASGGESAALSLSINGSGQGSASVIPAIAPVIKSYFGRRVPAIQYLFFLPFPVTIAQVLARLTDELSATVLAWPQFAPKSHIITLTGGAVSITAKAAAQCQVSFNPDNATVTTSEGEGYGVAIDRILKQEIIRPTIHGEITISTATASQDITVTASANTGTGTNFPGASASITKEGSAAGSITPTTLAATSPDAVPSSGLYLHDIQIGSYTEGFAKILAEVVDFANVV